MQQAIGGHAASLCRPVDAVDAGEPPARLGHDDGHTCHVVEVELGLGGDVDSAFGDEEMAPEVPVCAVAPDGIAQVVPAALMLGGHPLMVAVGQRGVGEPGDLGDVEPARFRGSRLHDVGTSAQSGPPAPAQRGRRHDPDDHPSLGILESHDRRPHRDPADEVLRPVDGIDDPPAAADADLLGLFLAEHPVIGEVLLDQLAHQAFDRLVGIAHRREVGLGLDLEVASVEASHRDDIGLGGQQEGEGEIVGVRHASTLPAPGRSADGPVNRPRCSHVLESAAAAID